MVAVKVAVIPNMVEGEKRYEVACKGGRSRMRKRAFSRRM